MKNIISKFKGAPVQACHPADRENCLQRRPRRDVRHLRHLWTSSPLSYSKVKPKSIIKKTFNPFQNLTRGSELTSGETLCRDNCQLIGMPFFCTRLAGKTNRN